ncbi:MAG: c-type cytochrome [Actinobacteria bacterium]|uniref:Cytochrome bc1 complex cytochrome c subunit n=1 Tax=freshwater metagenome TaxID=449393 RepID=A0A6J5ZQF3_9ZZZZ|nr:c-type cytochrome [Actinomycetota bacterium]
MAILRRHPAAVFAVLAVGLGTTGATYAAVSPAVQETAVVKAATQSEQGKSLFLEGCSSCHGLAAQGGSDGPSLLGVGAASVDFQVSTGRMPLAGPGRQAMAGPPSYTPEQTAQLAAYIASLAPGPEIPTQEMVDSTGANIAEGGVLFRTNCAQCHSVAGKGGALSEGAYAPSLMESDGKEIYEAMVTGPQSMPIFSDKTINLKEKKAIIAYIQVLQKQESPGGSSLGRLGPVTEGLFLFIAGLGALMVVAVWIGAKAK